MTTTIIILSTNVVIENGRNYVAGTLNDECFVVVDADYTNELDDPIQWDEF